MQRRDWLRLWGAWAAAAAAPAAQAHGAGHADAATRSAPPEQTDWGIASSAARPRVVQVVMDDRMRFTPAALDVREGEHLRLVVHNRGRLRHEFVLGTAAALDEHAALMQRFPDMAHDEPWMAHVDPGARGEIRWHFNRPGRFRFACLISGHYQAGMVGELTVRPRDGRPLTPAEPLPTASGVNHAH